jgi:hypothetical protein
MLHLFRPRDAIRTSSARARRCRESPRAQRSVINRSARGDDPARSGLRREGDRARRLGHPVKQVRGCLETAKREASTGLQIPVEANGSRRHLDGVGRWRDLGRSDPVVTQMAAGPAGIPARARRGVAEPHDRERTIGPAPQVTRCQRGSACCATRLRRFRPRSRRCSRLAPTSTGRRTPPAHACSRIRAPAVRRSLLDQQRPRARCGASPGRRTGVAARPPVACDACLGSI